MFKKIFSLFAALTLCVGLWAENSVITFTSTGKLYPVDIMELMSDFDLGDGAKWAAFKAQYPELAAIENPNELQMMGICFNPNAFLDANDQVLTFTIDYDESTHAGTITVNGELVKIAEEAFPDCTALTSITLPEGVTSIGYRAFSFCSLSSVTIPANVTYLGFYALTDNLSLTDVYVAWTTTLPTLEDNATFGNSPIEDATLHVPVGSLELYQNADVWKGFGSIVEYDPLQEIKNAAIAVVNAEIAESDNDNVKAIATDAATAINAATTIAEINALKTLAIANIASAKAAYTAGETAGYNTGYDEGEAAVRAELPTEGYEGPAVIITKGEKVLTLFNPEKVEYQILEAD